MALKVLSKSQLDSKNRARLKREAQMVAKLKHPNIVTIYDVGVHEEKPFIVMELIEGKTLLDKPTDNLAEIVSIAKQICAALQHAHEKNIIHRDLKPGNVLIDKKGSIILLDFGLARPLPSRMVTRTPADFCD